MKKRKCMFQLDEIGRLMILVIGFLIIVGIISRGNIASLFNVFGDKTPPSADAIARESTNALACAVDSVFYGKALPCVDDFKKSSGNGLLGNFLSAFAVKSNTDYPLEIDCNSEKTISKAKWVVLYVNTLDQIDQKKYFDCEENKNEKGKWGAWGYQCKTCGESERIGQTDNCQYTKCIVKNFQLPQKFGTYTPSQWVGAMGDPRYLVYYEKFPQGENNAWSGFSPWFKDASTIIFGTMCASSILGGAMKVGAGTFRLARHPITEGSRYLTRLTSVLKSFRNIPGLTLKVSEAARNGLSTVSLLKTKFGAKLLASYLKDQFKDTLIKKGMQTSFKTFKQIAPKVIGYNTMAASIATVSQFYDKRFGTEIGKFLVPYPNQIVLQKASVSQEGINLDYAKGENPIGPLTFQRGYPVIIDKGGDKYNSFFLASPCYSDLEVEFTKVACKSYSYDIETGETYCDSPKVYDKDNLPLCGSFETFQFYDLYKRSETGDEKKIFYDENGDGKWDQIVWREPAPNAINPSPETTVIHKFIDSDYDGYIDEYVYEKGGKSIKISGDDFKCLFESGNRFEQIVPGENGDDSQINMVNSSRINLGCTEPSYRWTFECNGEEKDNRYFCDKLKKNTNFSYVPDISLGMEVVDTDYDGKWDTLVDYFHYVKGRSVVVYDYDGDGSWDVSFGTRKVGPTHGQYVQCLGYTTRGYKIIGTKTVDCTILSKFNGKVFETFSLGSNYACVTPAVKVKVLNKDKFKGKVDYNYCYKTDDTTSQIILNTAWFAVDAIVSKIPNSIAQVSRVAFDCTVAFFISRYETHAWPGRKYS